MAHAAHTMASAMGTHVAESQARAMTYTSCGSHPRGVAFANVSCPLAMHHCGALAVIGGSAPSMDRRALAMNRAEVLRMHCRLA